MTARTTSLLVAAALVCGCASIEQLPTDYDGPQPLPAAIATQFCYEPSPIVDEVVLLKEGNSYDVFDVTMEAGLDEFDDDSPITFEFYEQKGGGPAPVAMLLPILNGQKDLLRPFASHFANNGYSVIIVNNIQRKTLLEDMIDPEPAIRQTIMRHRRVIDWAESRPGLDMSRFGVFGPSLGGFNALFLAAFDERVSVVSPALAGGSLADVLTTSDERRIVRAVDGVKEELGFDTEQLREHLRENIKTDTLAVAPHVNADRVLMVLAKYDDAVPYERQLELRNVMGDPEAITLPTGHITAAAYLFYLRSSVLDFFERKFEETTGHGTAALPEDWCGDDDIVAAKDPLLDRTQQTVHDVINGAARYFDSFFGSTDSEQGSNVSQGRLAVSGQYDDRNGFRQRFRLRTRIALPALRDRTRLILGRGDADEMIDGTANNNIDTLPGRFNDFEDDDWLIGVGFSRDQALSRGWDFSAGVTVRFPLEPYVRATYRWSRTFGDAWLWQLRPRVFAQSQRGTGASLTNSLDFAVRRNWMLRSWTVLQGEDDIEGLGWTQQFTAYHSISDRLAMSYNLFATGETDAEVPTQDYGFELRLRRRISRDWLFLELLGFVTWPRELLDEERELNPGVGIEFEMQFGDWPGRPQRR
jgi:dienelactone hydrolase